VEISSSKLKYQAGDSAPQDNPQRLSVLVLDEEIPYPLNSGKRIRTWNLLRYLARDYSITLLCYGKSGDPGFSELQQLGIRVVLVQELAPSNSFSFYAGALTNLFSTWPYSVSRHHTRRYMQTVRQQIATSHFDLLHCEWTPYASYARASSNLPMLIMAHNIEATVWRRRAEHASAKLEKLYMQMQATKMARFEKRCFAQAQRVATVTTEEQQTAVSWGACATSLVSNGVDTEFLTPMPDATEPNSILFLGSLDWQPNRDALQYLLREILPAIQSTNPLAVLRIVGRQPASKLREQVEGRCGIEWVGEVPDIRPHFARASVVVVPLRIGGGSRIKILESMSMSKAVVTTSIGAEGLEVVSGTHCLIADAPQTFANSVTELLNDPARAAELGTNGRNLVIDRYDWSRMAQELGRAWRATARLS
jgi:glycosyltransferase involved in cell wall biosynthesis